jgi:hypothetical protein
MAFENLDDDNFLLYAIKSYNSPHCVKSEFKEDLNRIRYVRRMIRAYKKTGDLKHRQILNHVIIAYNVFGNNATRILFYIMGPDEYPVLKTFLIFLNRMPDVVHGIKGLNIVSTDVQVDLIIAELLREV